MKAPQRRWPVNTNVKTQGFKYFWEISFAYLLSSSMHISEYKCRSAALTVNFTGFVAKTCLHPLLKIVPSKCTFYSFLSLSEATGPSCFRETDDY